MRMHSCALSLVVALGLTDTSFVNTFGIPRGLSKPTFQTTSTSLRISLWEADLASDLEGDDGDEETNESIPHKEAKQIEIIKFKDHESTKTKKSKKKKQKKNPWCPFYAHLVEQSHSIRDPWKRAIHMDDELKRLESRYYSLMGDETPQLYFPLGSELENYNGPTVKPFENTYQLVMRQYCQKNLGVEGAVRAEDLIARYERLNPSFVASTKMMKFAMKACMNAGDLERTEHWLDRIEKKYELTLSTSDYPGYYIYNAFVSGLIAIEGPSKKTLAKRAMEVLDKIGPRSEIATKLELFSSRPTYLEIMRYQERGYRGPEAFHRIEQVFRELQKNYNLTGKNPLLKPSIGALTPVFLAAEKCFFPPDQKVAKMAIALFDEYDQLYRETGDRDFLPNGVICNSLSVIYARMSQSQRKLSYYKNKTELLVQWTEEHGVTFHNPHEKTRVFNRILHAAETQMPEDPMSNPLKTKEIFENALDIFKKFHDKEVSWSPNKSTYLIFLRACLKLPEGEARTKLAKKAFHLCRQNDCLTAEAVFKLHQVDPDYAVSLLDTTDNLGFDRAIFHF